jgi:hypothetical protein
MGIVTEKPNSSIVYDVTISVPPVPHAFRLRTANVRRMRFKAT